MASLPVTGVMGRITFWPVNRPVVVKGLMVIALANENLLEACLLLSKFHALLPHSKLIVSFSETTQKYIM